MGNESSEGVCFTLPSISHPFLCSSCSSLDTDIASVLFHSQGNRFWELVPLASCDHRQCLSSCGALDHDSFRIITNRKKKYLPTSIAPLTFWFNGWFGQCIWSIPEHQVMGYTTDLVQWGLISSMISGCLTGLFSSCRLVGIPGLVHQ